MMQHFTATPGHSRLGTSTIAATPAGFAFAAC